MIRPGEVRAVRELSRGVQAQVCLGADPVHGSAVITVESSHPDVVAALDNLKAALREQANEYVGRVLEGQRAWDKEKGR